MNRDDKAFGQKGAVEGGRFLGEYQETGREEPRKVLPEVKGLKELNVAGPATQVFGYGRSPAAIPDGFLSYLFYCDLKILRAEKDQCQYIQRLIF